MTALTPCYHCGLPVPHGSRFTAEVLGQDREFCCPGCQAVAQAIVAGGLQSYYQHRSEASANKIMNKDQRDHTYVLQASGLPDLKLQGKREISVAAGDIVSLPVELSVAPEQLPSSANEVFFILKDADNSDITIKAKSRFIGPHIR